MEHTEMTTNGSITFRNTTPGDHYRIICVLPDWWGGRDLTASVPRLFLDHFNETSFIAEADGEIVGFLVAFFSPSRTDEGYAHFLGVHPDYRGRGLGRQLYQLFFDLCAGHGRRVVRACTSPVNRNSIAFHRKMGFTLEPGDAEVDGFPVTKDYNRPGDEKVLFKKQLG